MRKLLAPFFCFCTFVLRTLNWAQGFGWTDDAENR